MDFYRGEVVVLGKGNKHRKVYLNARSKLLLKQYLDSRDDESEYIFVSDRKPHQALKKKKLSKRLSVKSERNQD